MDQIYQGLGPEPRQDLPYARSPFLSRLEKAAAVNSQSRAWQDLRKRHGFRYVSLAVECWRDLQGRIGSPRADRGFRVAPSRVEGDPGRLSIVSPANATRALPASGRALGSALARSHYFVTFTFTVELVEPAWVGLPA
ncbi:hypothetical protein GCM10009788_33170 [Nocardioides humi]|uniref:Uncharacterized protein n=1 Tax=Nocardioides humi TaxID=449461 RepID=A0ABN2ATZ9_9ACTN